MTLFIYRNQLNLMIKTFENQVFCESICKMRVKFRIRLIFLSILLTQFKGNDCQQNRPQLPVSVLDEILRANATNGAVGSEDPLSMILGTLMPIMGSDNSGSDNSTGVGVLDFFRNLVAMFLRAVLQVFKFFQLLARTVTGNDGNKKLTFLSIDEKTIESKDNEISGLNTNSILSLFLDSIQK